MIDYGESLGVKRTGAKWTEEGFGACPFFMKL